MSSKLDKLIDRGRTSPQFTDGIAGREAIAAVGRAVRELRERSGFSQKELGTRAGMHASEVSRLEAGTLPRGPTVHTLVRIGQACRQSLEIVFKGQQDKRVPKPAHAVSVDLLLRLVADAQSSFPIKAKGTEDNPRAIVVLDKNGRRAVEYRGSRRGLARSCVELEPIKMRKVLRNPKSIAVKTKPIAVWRSTTKS